MSGEAPYRMVKLSYKQLVTMRLLLLHTCTTLAMRTNEFERVNVRSFLIKRCDFFERLKFPAIAGDAPIPKFTIHVCQSPPNHATANFCHPVKSARRWSGS